MTRDRVTSTSGARWMVVLAAGLLVLTAAASF
jgi:hypothetical protein